MSNETFWFLWYGKPNTDLSREELLEIIQFQQKEIESMRSEHYRQMDMLCSLRKQGTVDYIAQQAKGEIGAHSNYEDR